MMETPSNTMSHEARPAIFKAANTRRPLQPRSVNAPSSPSPAKSAKTTKPKFSSLVPRHEAQSKLPVVSENITEWPSINKNLPTPSLRSEPEQASQPSIFRRRSDITDDDDTDFFVLKRANPVYDSDDEDCMASPAKRQRTSEPTVLDWDDLLSEDEADTFCLPHFRGH